MQIFSRCIVERASLNNSQLCDVPRFTVHTLYRGQSWPLLKKISGVKKNDVLLHLITYLIVKSVKRYNNQTSCFWYGGPDASGYGEHLLYMRK